MKTKAAQLHAFYGSGYGVSIRRSDGSEFFCANEFGLLPPVWRDRKLAVKHKRGLIAQGFRARVVKVDYRIVPTES